MPCRQMASKMPEDLTPGEVLWVNFDPVVGREQAGRRPAVVVSSRDYNVSIPNVVIVVPVTTRDRELPHHIPLTGPEVGLTVASLAMTEQPRTIERRRIQGVAGRVDTETLRRIDGWLTDFLGRWP